MDSNLIESVRATTRRFRAGLCILTFIGREANLFFSFFFLYKGLERDGRERYNAIPPIYLSSTVSFSSRARLLRDRPKGFVLKTINRKSDKMEHDETGCQAPPEGPILCINNCGFFGSAATMNMCSKCHRDLILKQEQAKLAATSIENIVNGSSSGCEKEPVVTGAAINMQVDEIEPKIISLPASNVSSSGEMDEIKVKEGPSRCNTCKKRVGLTGFKCRCGNLFCGSHRYSDKHDCPFDYRTAARDAIAKANPVVKAEKLDKI